MIVDLKMQNLEQLREHWLSVLNSLKETFPLVTGRFRPDIYGDGNGVLCRDSAGTRVVTANSNALSDAVELISERWTVSEIKNFLGGHPRSTYYRGLHIYVRVEESEVEVQVRTQRQHLIADWAHDHLFLPRTESDWRLVHDQKAVSFLVALSAHYDKLDKELPAETLPSLPTSLAPHVKALGLTTRMAKPLGNNLLHD